MGHKNAKKKPFRKELACLRQKAAELERSAVPEDDWVVSLKESERRYRRMTETLADCIFTVRAEAGNPVEMRHGAGCLAVTGYTEEEFSADPSLWIDMVAAEDRAAVEDHVRRVSAGEEVPVLEYRIVRKDGKRRWIRNTPVPRREERDRLPVYDGLIQDVTDRKQAEEEIGRAMSLLNSTLEATTDGILVVDRTGKIVLYNQKFIGLWRIPESVIAARESERVLAFVLDQMQNPQAFLDKAKALLDQPADESFHVLEFIDGRVFESYSQPQRVGDQIIGRVGSFRDVTKHRRMDEALRLSEEAAHRLAKENEVIAEMGKIITASLNIEETYDRFAQEARKLIPFDRIMIALNNPEEGTAKVAYVSGADLEGRKAGDIYPLKGSGNEEVMRTRAGLIVQPENEEELSFRFSGLVPTFRSGFRSMMTVPLISGNQVIGALHFRSRKPKAYSGRDLKLAERIGDQIAGVIANARLFSERKLAEQALQDREERQKDILANIEEGYFEVDLAGNFTFLNDSLSRIIGLPKEKLLGMNNREYMDEESARRVFEIFHRVYTTGRPGKVFEWEFLREDGKRAIEECSVYLIKNARGAGIGFRGIVRDITERKQMEETLRKREERFKQGAENAGEWIWEVDERGLYTYASPVVEEILGYKPEEIGGKKYFYDFFDPAVRDQLKIASFEVFGKNQPFRKLENQNLHKDGHLVHLETSATPVLDAAGKLLGYRGADKDISERKRAEEERENLIRDLQKALSEVKTLNGLLPICSSCKKIRDDNGYWNQIESYIQNHSQAEFSHSICPECARKLYPHFLKK